MEKATSSAWTWLSLNMNSTCNRYTHVDEDRRNSQYVERVVLVRWSLHDPNVTDEIQPRTTTFRRSSTFHEVAAVSAQQSYCHDPDQCTDQPALDTAPCCQTTTTQQDRIYCTSDRLSSVASCVLTHCLDAYDKPYATLSTIAKSV